ncbi:MAG: inositol monophosphatase [Devosia sp.]|jgi:myo-inositol-1(or 4)-monophosphatase|uniref:inositol monophosphatase family protein n=1 Tax=Devosia sp. 66-22 TaxID=1895753 RepID=UPI0009258C7D|nr:inositol monophosphatase [Devosia sp. 66-22]MBN9344800.1 inositol monophosphatase [Devosia sp.]OJX47561.1 MAG: inositol monophosphatase [Devosia sp. 66-22]
MNYDAVLADMVAVAREAGALTLRHFARFRDLEIGIKGPADFVSDADRESEQLIRKELFARYPDWSFTGEEFPPVDGADREHRWLVDPIDGTTNFINGQHYTISIALRRGNATVCGALYNPVSDEMFTAVAGQGAWLNSERLTVSAQADVGLMIVGTGLPTPNLSLYPGSYQRLDAIRAPIGAVRIVGSAANSCAYVAMGRLTGYFEETGFVDTAAGILLVEEAGGIVTDWWGRGPEHYEQTGCLIVANRATHAYLLDKLKDVPMKNAAHRKSVA